MATIKQRLQAEIDRANSVTSKNDLTVHDAIGSLIDGFGSGGGADIGSIGVFVLDINNDEVVYIHGAGDQIRRRITT